MLDGRTDSLGQISYPASSEHVVERARVTGQHQAGEAGLFPRLQQYPEAEADAGNRHGFLVGWTFKSYQLLRGYLTIPDLQVEQPEIVGKELAIQLL
jgi:hypothetical protein